MSVHVVRLPENGKTYKLEDLIKNYDIDPVALEVPISNSAREIHLQAHPNNTGKIFGGEGSTVTLLTFAYVLTPTGQPRIYSLHDPATTHTWSKYFVSDTDDQYLCVELVND